MEPEAGVRRGDITAVVLCGGSSVRLGAIDKTMVRVGGRPLVAHTIEALRPLVGGFVISSGRDPAPYEALGHPVAVDDHLGDGPLGGIASGLSLVETAWVLTHPGDTPFPDPGLVERLAPSAERGGVGVPRAGDYRQHLVMLLSRAKAQELAAFYQDGGRAVKDWLDANSVQGVDMGDVADSFFNVNTEADLAEARRRLG